MVLQAKKSEVILRRRGQSNLELSKTLAVKLDVKLEVCLKRVGNGVTKLAGDSCLVGLASGLGICLCM